MKKIHFLFLFLVFVYSCQNDDKEYELDNSKIDQFFVDLQEVTTLAKVIQNKNSDISTRSTLNKTIDTILPVPDTEGTTAYYIINYKEGGFVVISADKRTNPILAFSENSSITLEDKFLPSGLLGWFGEMQEDISTLRNEETVQSKSAQRAWGNPCEITYIASFLESNSEVSTDLGCEIECPNIYYEAGPFLKTEWGQGIGYNDLCPYMNCSKYTNLRAPAGCVANATAQIMKYYEYPKNAYNWNYMYNIGGSNETAKLMADLGRDLDMNYGCDGSFTSTEKVVNVLKNKYKYSSANFSNFDLSIATSELLNKKRPIILSGGRKSGWWIFATYKDGHAWVCDGYKYFLSYNEDCSTGIEHVYLHMNWGWNDRKYNGWYSAKNWNPGENTFNYEKKMITSIYP